MPRLSTVDWSSVKIILMRPEEYLIPTAEGFRVNPYLTMLNLPPHIQVVLLSPDSLRQHTYSFPAITYQIPLAVVQVMSDPIAHPAPPLSAQAWLEGDKLCWPSALKSVPPDPQVLLLTAQEQFITRLKAQHGAMQFFQLPAVGNFTIHHDDASHYQVLSRLLREPNQTAKRVCLVFLDVNALIYPYQSPMLDEFDQVGWEQAVAQAVDKFKSAVKNKIMLEHALVCPDGESSAFISFRIYELIAALLARHSNAIVVPLGGDTAARTLLQKMPFMAEIERRLTLKAEAWGLSQEDVDSVTNLLATPAAVLPGILDRLQTLEVLVGHCVVISPDPNVLDNAMHAESMGFEFSHCRGTELIRVLAHSPHAVSGRIKSFFPAFAAMQMRLRVGQRQAARRAESAALPGVMGTVDQVLSSALERLGEGVKAMSQQRGVLLASMTLSNIGRWKVELTKILPALSQQPVTLNLLLIMEKLIAVVATSLRAKSDFQRIELEFADPQQLFSVNEKEILTILATLKAGLQAPTKMAGSENLVAVLGSGIILIAQHQALLAEKQLTVNKLSAALTDAHEFFEVEAEKLADAFHLIGADTMVLHALKTAITNVSMENRLDMDGRLKNAYQRLGDYRQVLRNAEIVIEQQKAAESMQANKAKGKVTLKKSSSYAGLLLTFFRPAAPTVLDTAGQTQQRTMTRRPASTSALGKPKMGLGAENRPPRTPNVSPRTT